MSKNKNDGKVFYKENQNINVTEELSTESPLLTSIYKPNEEVKEDWYTQEFNKVWKELEDKRNFGLKKYGAISFQNNLENLCKCELLEHLEQELIDSINYQMAQLIKMRILKKYLSDNK